ncbi:MAG: hypothetical protein EOP83_11590 [Verrucomicrobiaceae bacterium]|nr:MAG: hypothetical protein EOP83_11590 [Verrucomicrobiaceae bacterium]
MALVNTDIDIDFANRDHALTGLHHIPATVKDAAGRHVRHVSGVYFQPVPIDPLSGLCAYPYEDAAERGYFKVDFLNNSIYQGVRDEAHLDDLLAQEVPWDLFDDIEFVKCLPHVGGHYGTVQSIKPRSIEDLAVILALMRPGMRHLIGQPRATIDAQIWVPNSNGYVFKRAHAIAYAVSIVVKLLLIVEQLGSEVDAEKANDAIF